MSYVHARLVATYGEHDAIEALRAELGKDGMTLQHWEAFCVARSLCCFSDLDQKPWTLLAQREDAPFSSDDAPADAMRHTLHSALKFLKPKQAKILRMRYGIGKRSHTLQEVADVVGLTRERVRQIQMKSEDKLRWILRREFGIEGIPNR